MIRNDLNNPLVVIGAGMAGLNFIREFRKLSNKEIVLIDQSEKKVYSKPQLSNFFKNNKKINELVQLDLKDFCEQQNCFFISSRVCNIDSRKKKLSLENKEEIIYEDLILAIGGNPVNPLADLKNIYTYNSLEDLSKIIDNNLNRKKICILGGGIVSVELANDLIMSGFDLDITIISRSKFLLESRVPLEVSNILESSLIQNNIKIHLDTDLKNVSQIKDQVLIETNKITELYDMVIVAYGIKVDSSICKELFSEKGIVTDLYLKTNLDHIFAIGDCAQIKKLYMPFVAPMLSQSKSLAMTISGNSTKVALIPNPLNVKTPVCPILIFGPYDDSFYWEKKSDDSWIAKNGEGEFVGACLIKEAAKNQRIEIQEILGNFFQKKIGT